MRIGLAFTHKFIYDRRERDKNNTRRAHSMKIVDYKFYVLCGVTYFHTTVTKVSTEIKI
jgi:hypothetical protein